MPQRALRMPSTQHPAPSKPIPNWRTQQCGVRAEKRRAVENEVYGATVSAFDLSTVQYCIKHCLSCCSIVSHPTQGLHPLRIWLLVGFGRVWHLRVYDYPVEWDPSRLLRPTMTKRMHPKEPQPESILSDRQPPPGRLRLRSGSRIACSANQRT